MDRKYDCPINLAYCIDMSDIEGDDAMPTLLRRLPRYFEKPKNNQGYGIYVSHNNKVLFINVRGKMEVEFSLVDSSAAGYHAETDGESEYACMSEEDFRQILIDAFKECANDIVDCDVYNNDGTFYKTAYLSETIGDYLCQEDVGYPSDEEIWGLLA
jgi:hypothetical protein